jgi:putative addiction module component (TIGR02574 family)
MTRILQDILKLSVSERIIMVEAIWDSIAENHEQVELTSETKQLLDDRLEVHKNNPDQGSSWNEAKARIKKQF